MMERGMLARVSWCVNSRYYPSSCDFVDRSFEQGAVSIQETTGSKSKFVEVMQ